MLEKSNQALNLRAHTILLIRIEDPLTSKTVGKMYFADLAGSGIFILRINIIRTLWKRTW